MKVDSDDSYMIGYRKPPKETRWRKGISGNPKGRPKKPNSEANPQEDPGKVIQSVDNEKILVTVDEKSVLMRKGEIHFRQLFAKAIKGDLKAARHIANLAAEYLRPDKQGPSETHFIVKPNKNPSSGKLGKC